MSLSLKLSKSQKLDYGIISITVKQWKVSHTTFSLISTFPTDALPCPSLLDKCQPQFVFIVAVGEETYAPAVGHGGDRVIHVDVHPPPGPPHTTVHHPHVYLLFLVDLPQSVIWYQL